MKTLFSVIYLVSTGFITACGGSNTIIDAPALTVVSPQERSTFQPSEVLTLQLAIKNFKLQAPPDAAAIAAKGQKGSLHTMHSMPGLKHAVEVHAEELHAHDDTASENSVSATKQGHYHLYLDDAQGSDPHITGWTLTPVVRIPDSIRSGTHVLRFEFRNDQHAVYSNDFDLYYFFEVQ